VGMGRGGARCRGGGAGQGLGGCGVGGGLSRVAFMVVATGEEYQE
jgi:hypothetical protein